MPAAVGSRRTTGVSRTLAKLTSIHRPVGPGTLATSLWTTARQA
jgi:hypothetical protein